MKDDNSEDNKNQNSHGRQAFRYSKEAIAELESSFSKSPYLNDKNEILRLHKILGVDKRAILSWFAYRRRKNKTKTLNQEDSLMENHTENNKKPIAISHPNCPSQAYNISSFQENFLEKSYLRNANPTCHQMQNVSRTLQIPFEAISSWFEKKNGGVEIEQKETYSESTTYYDPELDEGTNSKLLNFYCQNTNPTWNQVEELSADLSLPKMTIFSWFDKCKSHADDITNERSKITGIETQLDNSSFEINSMSLDSPVSSPSPEKHAISVKYSKEADKISSALTDLQFDILTATFDNDPFYDEGPCQELSHTLQMEESTIKQWFKNKRKQLKNRKLKIVNKVTHKAQDKDRSDRHTTSVSPTVKNSQSKPPPQSYPDDHNSRKRMKLPNNNYIHTNENFDEENDVIMRCGVCDSNFTDKHKLLNHLILHGPE